MAKTAPKPAPSKQRPNATGRWAWLTLGGVTALGAVLRAAFLNQSPGGFHVYNEIFYLQLASREQARDAFAWFYNPLDVNNPPLFNALASAALRFHGPPVASMRLISVLAGVAAIVLVFLLGRQLYDERTGLVSAAVLAVMPGAVLVSHNIQVDSLFVTLMLAGLFFYVRAARRGTVSDAVAGGVLLGLSMLSKQPAILVLPALAVWRSWAQGGFAWLRERTTWVFVSATLAVGGSWYLFELVVAPQRLIAGMVGVASRSEMSTLDADFWINGLAGEIAWMLFPLAAVVAAAGIVVMISRRESGDRLVLVLLAVFLIYYIAFHKHVYYLLPVTPFFALAIGRGCVSGLTRRYPAARLRVVGISLLVAVMAFGSVMTMSGLKWGRWSPMELRLEPDPGFARVHLYYHPGLDDLYWALQWAVNQEYSPESASAQEYVGKPSTPGTGNLFLSPRMSTPDGTRVPSRDDLTETWVRPVLFGYAFSPHRDLSSRTQVFTNEPWFAERVGPPWRFGIDSASVYSGLSVYSVHTKM